MAMSVDVTLPRSQEAFFPDECCVCGRERPGDLIPVARRRASWWELFLPWVWFLRKPFRCAAPACANCRVDAIRHHRWLRIALVLVLIVASIFVMPWVKSWGLSRQWSRLLSLALVLASIMPVMLWWVVRPPFFDVTVRKDTVDYEFRDPDYAFEFAVRNGGTIDGDVILDSALDEAGEADDDDDDPRDTR